MNAPARRNVGLLVGVDGGGTGCRARIEDAEGSVLGTGIAGPAAVRLGIDRSLAAVESACRAAAAEAGLERPCRGTEGVKRQPHLRHCPGTVPPTPPDCREEPLKH